MIKIGKDFVKRKCNKLKKKIFKKIMLPYGAIFIFIVLSIGAIFGSFSSDGLNDNLSLEDKDSLNKYIIERTTFESIDYLHLDNGHFLKPSHVNGFLNFLVINDEANTDTLEKAKKEVDKIIDDKLKSNLKYKDAKETKKRTYMKAETTVNEAGEETVTYKQVTEETTNSVKLLTYAKSIYNEADYYYEDDVITEVFNEDDPNKKETLIYTKPKLVRTDLKDNQYDGLRQALKKVDSSLTDEDIETFVEVITAPTSFFGEGGKWGSGNLLGVPPELIPHFEESGQIFNIPPWLLASVGKHESNFNPNAVSHTGATGIMQIQKIDIGSGKDLWAWLIDIGLGDIYRTCGYSFSNSEHMWEQFKTDPRAQIIAGAYEVRYYINYVLNHKGLTDGFQRNSNENMNLVNWSASRDDADLKDIIRRSIACYNMGPGGVNVTDLDKGLAGYPNKVFETAMTYRDTGLSSGTGAAAAVVNEAVKHLGTPYVWGGRNPGGFDCSGLMQYSYKTALGIDIGATTHSQCKNGTLIGSGPMDESLLQPGDLLFRSPSNNNDGAHVVMYMGDGKIIHAPQTGDVVKIITYDNLKSWMRIDMVRRYVF
ncbi:MAG: NlpC/P60 family protein [Clostridium sp.]